MKTTYTLERIGDIATWVIENAASRILLFDAPMGTGKTTLIKSIAQALGSTNTTSSPTFSLVNPYELPTNEEVYHFDMYRLNHYTEALDMGFEEYLDSGNWCCIEWPEKVEELWPLHYTLVRMSVETDGSRRIELQNI